MSGTEHKKNFSDRYHIDTGEEFEIRYWIQKLGVSRPQLMDAIQRVGSSVNDVKAFLATKETSPRA